MPGRAIRERVKVRQLLWLLPGVLRVLLLAALWVLAAPVVWRGLAVWVLILNPGLSRRSAPWW